jgi:hypothetical protein
MIILENIRKCFTKERNNTRNVKTRRNAEIDLRPKCDIGSVPFIFYL